MKEKTYFYGEHFDGMGGIWSGLCGADTVIMHLPNGINEAKPLFQDDKQNILELVEECNDDISILHLLKLEDKQAIYYSSCPLLKGMDYKLKLKEHFTWANGAEGEFSAIGFKADECSNSICFHGEKYIEDINNFKRNKEQTISLSAVAFSLEKLEERRIDLDKGALHDTLLQKFIKDNPRKTKNNFRRPTILIDAEHFRMFSRTKYACEYQIAAPIVEISTSMMLDKEIYKLTVNLVHGNEEPCYLPIYTSKENLNGYEPKIGDGIMGIVRCMGYFK